VLTTDLPVSVGSTDVPPAQGAGLAMTAAVIPSQNTLLTSNEGSDWLARELGAQRAASAPSMACAR